MTWLAIGVAAGCCYVAKVAGLSVPDRILRDRRTRSVADVLPIALLAALALSQTVVRGRHIVADARLAGMAVALVAVALRAPFLVVVAAAAATAAALRLVT